MKIHKLLSEKYSYRCFSCKGEYPNHEIEWLDDLPEPTEQELLDSWDVLMEEEAANEYKNKREMEYPSAHELLISLWEHVVEGRPEAAQKLQQQREVIKNKYPKPAE